MLVSQEFILKEIIFVVFHVEELHAFGHFDILGFEVGTENTRVHE